MVEAGMLTQYAGTYLNHYPRKVRWQYSVAQQIHAPAICEGVWLSLVSLNNCSTSAQLQGSLEAHTRADLSGRSLRTYLSSQEYLTHWYTLPTTYFESPLRGQCEHSNRRLSFTASKRLRKQSREHSICNPITISPESKTTILKDITIYNKLHVATY